MLKQMRAQTKNLRWVLWLVILAFLVGFVWMFQGGGGRTQRRSEDFAAKVGGRTITVEKFQQTLENQDRYLRQMLGDSYRPQFLNGETVMNSLVERALLLHEADKLGIVVTPEEIADHLRSMKGLQDEDGNFDRSRYEDYLQMSRMRPSEFEAELADDLRLGELDDVFRGGVVLTDAEVRTAWLDQNETASIEYVVVPLSNYLPTVTVADDELKAHFDAHASDFDAGPARKVQWVRFSREDALKSLEDEAAMRKYYDDNVEAIYTMTDAQRRASVILVASPKDASVAQKADAKQRAEAIAAEARRGGDFGALAKTKSEDMATRDAGGDLGPFYQGALEAAVDTAVFAAKEGDVVGPIETSRGFQILKVTKGPGVKARPYEDVRALVSRGLYARQVAEKLQADVKRFQDAYAAKPDFAAAATTAGLTLGGPEWVNEGRDVPGLGKNPSVVSEAFRLEVGGVSEPLAEPGGQIVVNLLEKRDSSPRTFDEARADVEQAVRTEKARALAKTEAESLRTTAATTGTVAVAEGKGTLQTAGPFPKAGPITGLGDASDVLAAVFETNEGSVGRVADAGAGEVIFKVTTRKPFDQAAFDAAKVGVERRLRDQRLQVVRQDTVARLRKSNEDRIVINESVLAPFKQSQGG